MIYSISPASFISKWPPRKIIIIWYIPKLRRLPNISSHWINSRGQRCVITPNNIILFYYTAHCNPAECAIGLHDVPIFPGTEWTTCHSYYSSVLDLLATTWAVFSYKLRYIIGFWLVEMAISTNQKPTINSDLYENTAPGSQAATWCELLKRFRTRDELNEVILWNN